MVVHPERMRENLERSRGVVFSGTRAAGAGAPRRLARAGVRVGAAQRHARRSTKRRPFKDLLVADADLGAVLSREDIDRAFDLGVHLRHVDAIVRAGVSRGEGLRTSARSRLRTSGSGAPRRQGTGTERPVGAQPLCPREARYGWDDRQVQGRVRRLRDLRPSGSGEDGLPGAVRAPAPRPGERRHRRVERRADRRAPRDGVRRRHLRPGRARQAAWGPRPSATCGTRLRATAR